MMLLPQRLLLIFFLLLGTATFGQDSTQHKNTIKWNLTPALVSSPQSIVLGYERVLNESQSFSVNAGYVQFPTISGYFDSTVEYNGTRRNNGFSLAGDYRFYLTDRNKKAIPDGVYIAPYFLFYYFDQLHEVEYIDGTDRSSVGVSTQITSIALGVELGYQFTFGDHWTLDLILIGPSFGRYNISSELNGTLPGNLADSDVFDSQYGWLEAAFPALTSLIETGEFNSSGNTGFWGVNYRFVIQVGYRF